MIHQCLKCRANYEDTDPEPYLCASCLAERKAIAKQVDAQFANRVRPQVKSDLQEYEESAKFRGFMIVK